jgi:anti-sigma factor RsiW
MNLPTCRELLDFLSDYLADELPAETKAAFERHLALCPECVNYVENFRLAVQSARSAFSDPPSPVPESLVQAILRSRSPSP